MMVMMSSTLALRLLPKLTTRLMSSQIIQSRKPSLAPHPMILAQHMLVLRSMRRHMSFKVAAFTVEVDLADGTIHLVAAVVARHVLVADVLVSKGLRAVRQCAFEGSL